MKSLQTFIRKYQILMLIVLPVWVAIGRVVFDAMGWFLIFTVFIIGPGLLLALLAVWIMGWFRRDVRGQQLMPRLDTWLLAATYASAFLFGFFLVDGGDAEDSVNSAFTALVHSQSALLQAASALIATGAAAVGAVTLVGLLVRNVVQLVRQRSA